MIDYIDGLDDQWFVVGLLVTLAVLALLWMFLVHVISRFMNFETHERQHRALLDEITKIDLEIAKRTASGYRR